jgi:hypothetical protein
MHPEWVMFGVDAGDGTVHLYASKTLSYVQLEAIYEEISMFGRDFTQSLVRCIEFSGELRDFVLVAGADYAEAFRRLFDTWTPGGSTAGGGPTARLTPHLGVLDRGNE